MFHATLITISRKYFFGFPRNILFGPKIFIVEIFSKFFWKVLLFMFHAILIIMSRKCFFGFRSLQLPFDIYDFELEVSPLKCDLGSQASPLQLELGIGSSRYRRYVSRRTKSKFLKYFLETTFLYV